MPKPQRGSSVSKGSGGHLFSHGLLHFRTDATRSLSYKAKCLDIKLLSALVSHMANLDHIFHSLSDGTRRAVIAQLANGPASIGDLARHHHMALPSFMKHIRVLEQSELVVSRKTGRVRMCELRSEALTAAQDWLEQERRVWGVRLDQLDALIETLAAKENTNGNK